MPQKFKNYVGGQWIEPASGHYFENVNPAKKSDVIGDFPESSAADVDAAAKAARAAFHSWSRTPAPQRGEILRKVGDLLVERKNDLAFEMTREMGKPFTETRGDVQEAIDTAYYAASETRRLFGRTVPSELPNKFNMTIRRPVGVCGIITAWNFPIAVPTWKLFPALASGNCVIFKPSEDAPHLGMLLVQVLVDAGIPTGVVNLVQGRSEAGAALVSHPEVDAIGFTGSSETGARIGEVCGRMHKRVSMEMGGKNPMIVLQDAQLDLAIEGVLWGAFGTTGQRCTATSRLIVHEKVHDKLVHRLCERAGKLRLGYGNDAGVDVGPLINSDALGKVERYVEIGKQEGAQVVLGGRRATGDGLDEGFFYKPTVFTGVTPDMRIAREEIFGPVLSVLEAGSYEEAVAIANDTKYGLSSSIYTQDVSLAFRAMHDIEAGITYINGPTIGAEAHMPFGGVKETGNGHREGGWEVFDFYTETKTVYVDYSGHLQKAQIDNVD
ncbi:MAG TPA: aldehyde dehydrogenase family protein [Rhodothermales bacterium]|nr:aldehyde dehydrogenase family protein [Rhodothermales bacterium]